MTFDAPINAVKHVRSSIACGRSNLVDPNDVVSYDVK